MAEWRYYQFLQLIDRRVEPSGGPREQGTGQGQMASSWARKGLDWRLGKIPSPKELPTPGTGSPGQIVSPFPKEMKSHVDVAFGEAG